MAVAASWAAQAGVDRETLSALGVPRRVLDCAGVSRVPARDRLRRHWEPMPCTVADLARRSGLSEAAVRLAIAQEESEGVLTRVGRQGRTILYGRVR